MNESLENKRDDELPVVAVTTDIAQTGSWNEVFLPTEKPVEEKIPLHHRPESRWPNMVRVLLPVFLLVFYGLWKFLPGLMAGEEVASKPPEIISPTAPSLTGVAPRPEPTPTEDVQLEVLLSELESRRAKGDWAGILEKAGSEAFAHLAARPAVRGFSLLARHRTGTDLAGLEEEITALEPRLAGLQRLEPLLVELRLARADLLVRRVRSVGFLKQNTDLLMFLILNAPINQETVQLRQTIARRYEELADELAAKSTTWSRDRAALAEARELYQTGLRFILAEDGWMEVRPISPGTRPNVGRILAKIETTNRFFHGTVLPFSGKNPSTWTGIEGDPIHDIPVKDSRP